MILRSPTSAPATALPTTTTTHTHLVQDNLGLVEILLDL